MKRWTLAELGCMDTKDIIIALLNERAKKLDPMAPLAHEITLIKKYIRDDVPAGRPHMKYGL